ncbi:MAG: bifunctional nuclease domain-containing protein [Bdellovibrionota bacterium]
MSNKNDILKDIEKVIGDLGIDDLLSKIENMKEEDTKVFDAIQKAKDFDEDEYLRLIPFGMMSGMSLAKPVFLFKDEDEIYNLPVSLGLHQANLIALSMGPAISGSSFSLVKKIFKHLNVEVLRLVFTEFKDQALIANLDIEIRGEKHQLKTTAEEALSLGLEFHADFFAKEDLLEKAKTLELEKNEIQQELEISLEKEKTGQKYLM